MEKLKNFTPQLNDVFELGLSNDSILVIYYLNSRPKNWTIYKSQVQNQFNFSDKRIDKCWKQIQQLGLLTKRRVFNKENPRDNVIWTFHKDALTAICANGKIANSEMRSQQNTLTAKRANGKVANSKIACLPTTDVSITMDGGENMDVSTNMDVITNTDLVANTEVMGDDGIKRWIVNNNVPTSSIIHSQFPELAIDKIEILRNEAIDESFYNI